MMSYDLLTDLRKTLVSTMPPTPTRIRYYAKGEPWRHEIHKNTVRFPLENNLLA
jgi:hypothetical protein